MLNVLTIVATLVMLSAFEVLYWKNVAASSVLLAVFGVCILPCIPICYGFTVELTYPLSEALSNGIMMTVSQIYGTGIGFIA